MSKPLRLKLHTRDDPTPTNPFKVLVQITPAPKLAAILAEIDAIDHPDARKAAAIIRQILAANREAERS